MKCQRLPALLLCLLMVAATLIGCTQPGSTATTASTSEAETQSATVSPTDATQSATPEAPDPFGKYDPPITITTVRTMDATVQFDENDPEKKSFAENRWINAYRDKLGINVEHLWIASDNDANMAKWSTAIASGNVPDTAIVNDAIYKLLLEGDLIADMTETYEQYASPGYRACTKETNIKQMWYGEALRGLPYATKAYTGTNLLFARQDWLDALNLDVPKTIDDVVSTAKAFQQAGLGGENTIGILFGNGATNDGRWEGFLNGYGAYLNYWIEKNGALVFSNTQDEMKTALMAMQALYTDGVMNKDFAATTTDLAQEYVASGKAGLFYGYSWIPFSSLLALYENDKEGKVVVTSIYPPSVSGEKVPIQTNAPTTRKIFVSKSCEHPEAAVKLVNLSVELADNDADHYYVDLSTGSGFQWYKYIIWGDALKPVTYTIDKNNACRVADETGVRDFFDAAAEADYDTYLLAKKGEAPRSYLYFAPDGPGVLVYDAYTAGLLLENKFMGLNTETMALKGSVINDELKTAMMEVIMGADISVYDKAVETWYASGGQNITDEVNEWYRSIS